MEPRETAARYDRLASWYQQSIPESYGIEALKRALKFATTRGSALDVGCGSNGRFLQVLLEEDFRPEGLDFSGEMIALARVRHPKVEFHHADICEWSPPRRYDLITAWDSTFHLPLSQQEPVLRKLCAALAPAGVLLFTCGGTSVPEEITGAMEGLDFGYSSLGVEEYLRILRHCQCACRHLEHDQFPEKHMYIIAQKGDAPPAQDARTTH